MSTISLPHRRRWLSTVIVGVLVAIFLFTILAGLIVEILWYDEIHQSPVFWHTLSTKIWLGVVFGVLFFALLYVNLVIARRIRPEETIVANPLDPVERVRDATEPYLGWLLPVGAGVLAFLVGLSVSGNWQTFLLWRNAAGVTFGNPEPLFHRDPAFYVFSLPWLRFLQGWLFSSLIGVTLLVAIGHVLWGGIRPQAPAFADKVTPAARAHLSVLLGLVMLVKAWGYWLGRFDLLTSQRGVVEGASYTEVKAQLPALNFLTLVAVICAVLFFLNIRTKQWSLPIVAVALLAIVSVLLGTAYPAFVQQFKVKPNEQQLEAPYIGYNITATSNAFGLSQIQQQSRETPPHPLSAAQLKDNRATVSNIRLWRPSTLQKNFAAFQQIRQYYNFLDVDVDRYTFDGDKNPRVIMVSARELNPSGIQPTAQTWQNTHLTYTHGYGAVASQVNTASVQGQPVLTLKNLPSVGEPAMDHDAQRIYYGEEDQGSFVVAGAQGELDYDGGPQNVPYVGGGGIPVDNIFRRLLFAWNFRDINLLLSNQITDSSRLMIYRNIEQRAAKAVPFLRFDSDPYLAIVDGRADWILDAYTTTNEYPYSEAVSGTAATDGQFGGTFNYIQNSVKVVIDAYTGEVTYWANLDDPIIQVWSKAFPGLFQSITSAPDDLQAHFRYPENLFQVQAYQFANYHVTDPASFYQRRDFWQVSPDPTLAPDTSGTPPPMRPYYQLIRLQGEGTEAFQLVIPFVPAGRPNMVGWMAANSDPGEQYGHITMFRFPEGNTTSIEGPPQVFARINNDPAFSSFRTLVGQQGSTLSFGDFLVIPVEDSFLYVLPVYVTASDASPAIPELKRVIVVNGSEGEVSLGKSLPNALGIATSGVPTGGGNGPGGNGGPATGSVDHQIQDLLNEALTHFQKADAALTNGDLATYQSELAQAQALVQQAQQLAASNAGGGGSGSQTPSPPPPPSATASPPVTASPSASP